MIWFNDIELDYYSDTLNKLVVKKSLADIETLSNRKGTSSTTFDVPRTAHNEKAFGFITIDGTINETKGTSRIVINNNIYSEGVLWVLGYDDDNFKCNYFGLDIDLINDLKTKYVYQLLDNQGSDCFAYNDANFQNWLGTVYTSGSLDMAMYSPMLSLLDAYSPDKLSAKTIAPHFTVKSIIEQILSGYTIESDFFDTEYHNYTYYSNFNGKHRPFNRADGSTTNLLNYLPTLISIGNMSTETSNISKSGNDYVITRAVEELTIRLKANSNTDASMYIWVFDSSDAIIGRSNASKLLQGDNVIEFTLSKTIPINSYFNVGVQGDNGTTIITSDIEIYTDNIQFSDYICLRDYAGTMTQFDFLSNYLKHHNLVMDIQGERVYIDPQDDCQMHVSTGIVNIQGIAKESIDISEFIESKRDVTFDYIQNDILNFEQKTLSNDTMTDYQIQINQQVFGGSLFTLNSYKKGTETVTSEFNTVYDEVDNIQTGSTSPITPSLYDSWDNVLTTQIAFFGTFGDTYSETYTNMDTSTTLIDVFWYYSGATRFNLIAPKLFARTIEQKKNNKVIECRLFDELGTLITFRKNYIISGQLYKCMEIECDVQSKECIIKLQLM